jgi:hypothetical protein
MGEHGYAPIITEVNGDGHGHGLQLMGTDDAGVKVRGLALPASSTY